MKQKIRVLFFNHVSILSGGEKSLLDILTNIDRHKIEPILLCPTSGPLTEAAETNEIKVIKIKMDDNLLNYSRTTSNVSGIFSQMKNVLGTIRLVRKVIKEEDIDILYSNSMKAHLISSAATIFQNTKSIWHVRDIIDNKLLSHITNLFSILPNRVICISKAVKDQFYFKKNKTIIFNGIKSRGNVTETKSEDNLFRIAIIGQIAKWKGQETLIKAANEILKTRKDFRFFVVGEALFKDEITYKDHIKSIAHPDIEFLGYRKDIPELINHFDLLVHAAIKPEPFGRIIIEAMDAGIPIIATNIGGPKEIIDDKKTGFLYEPGDYLSLTNELLTLSEERTCLKKVSQAAKLRFESNFRLENTINQIELVIMDTIRR
ncbi:glycosyltransferase [Terribacillus sp. AE2B 122]|uniref:glycosyltransferase n=1 Tax=Terribacillus sp. AE2B 122 TaxID=1331902 RepID=UPI0014409C5A|nr:glycosyltransferase [Terribacillus sp. AE2B 122]VVM33376.1 glycosyl transferase [Terribacillus sp. AE2B 122]